MKKRIRSISISENIDEELIKDSNYRGLTISANLTRILYDYFKSIPHKGSNLLKVNRN